MKQWPNVGKKRPEGSILGIWLNGKAVPEEGPHTNSRNRAPSHKTEVTKWILSSLLISNSSPKKGMEETPANTRVILRALQKAARSTPVILLEGTKPVVNSKPGAARCLPKRMLTALSSNASPVNAVGSSVKPGA